MRIQNELKIGCSIGIALINFWQKMAFRYEKTKWNNRFTKNEIYLRCFGALPIEEMFGVGKASSLEIKATRHKIQLKT